MEILAGPAIFSQGLLPESATETKVKFIPPLLISSGKQSFENVHYLFRTAFVFTNSSQDGVKEELHVSFFCEHGLFLRRYFPIENWTSYTEFDESNRLE